MVRRQVIRVEEAVLAHAEATGTRFEWDLTKAEDPARSDAIPAEVADALRSLSGRELIVIQKGQSGMWSVSYRRVRPGSPIKASHLRDASLLVQRRFLRQAERFAQDYAREARLAIELRQTEGPEADVMRDEANAAIDALGGAAP